MSRCFSYPPPGYVLSSAKKEALIELIKLQEEKLRKKEKKERKKREREQNRKVVANPRLEKSNIRSSQNGLTNTKSEFLRNEKEHSGNEKEHSGLTEEHKCPTGFSVPSSSSESTEKSKKRKSNEHQQPCSTSEWSDMSEGTSRDKSSNTTAHNTEQICSTSSRTETDNKRTLLKKAVLTPIQKLDLQYTSLLVDCFSLPVQDVCAFPTDNLEWLLNQETRAVKKSRFGNESLSCCRSFGLWPRAKYLPEVGMYALPYTVPY